MSALQWCWVAVTITSIIFLIVAAISALPKMKAGYTACVAVIFLAASGITAFGSFTPIVPAAAGSVPAVLALAPAPGGAHLR